MPSSAYVPCTLPVASSGAPCIRDLLNGRGVLHGDEGRQTYGAAKRRRLCGGGYAPSAKQAANDTVRPTTDGRPSPQGAGCDFCGRYGGVGASFTARSAGATESAFRGSASCFATNHPPPPPAPPSATMRTISCKKEGFSAKKSKTTKLNGHDLKVQSLLRSSLHAKGGNDKP